MRDAFVTFARCEDWIVMFVNGRKVESGHSLGEEAVAEALKGYTVKNVFSIEVDQEWAETNFPVENLSEIPTEARV